MPLTSLKIPGGAYIVVAKCINKRKCSFESAVLLDTETMTDQRATNV